MKTLKTLLPVLVCLVPVIFSGCGKSGPSYVEVAGTVLLDGEPVDGATVTFVPQEPSQVGGAGRTDASGNFTLTASSGQPGITTGSFKVTVRKVEGEGFDGGPGASQEEKEKAMMAMMMGEAKPPKYVIPAVYSDAVKTSLLATVTDDASKNQFKFEVKSNAR